MSFKLTVASKTDVGRQREQNEDAVYAQISENGETGLFVVADGMGGYQAGEIASRIVVETVRDALKHYLVPVYDQPTVKLAPISEQETILLTPAIPEDATMSGSSPAKHGGKGKTRKLPETASAKSTEDQLKAALRQTNKAIFAYGEQHQSAHGMGCTVTMALVSDGQVHIANIGDSRTYLLRQGKLFPLTKDHSLVARLVETKLIEPDDVYTHPQRNLIFRSLGAGHRTVDPDVFHQALRPGDTLLLCSDGLWEMVRDPLLLKVLSEQHDVEKACKTLIDLANANGGEDNISVVIVRVQ
jgi:serine/threonine protein phosphatase PrpC